MKPPQITTGDQAFAPRKQYAIPSYQRNYVWTKEDHWEPLWEDIKELTRQVLGSDAKTRPHFLGTIITKEIATESGFIDGWWVVDGQQRLTTLQLFIAAARASFIERGLTRSADILSGLLANPDTSIDKPRDKYKIKHKSSDYAGFAALIDAALSSSNGDLGESPLDKCYVYFLSEVTEWLNRSNDDQPEGRRAGALTTAILKKLQVVDIRLDDTENSHAIFEALNARGAPLTEWEKVKNYLLSIAVGEDDPDGDAFYQDHLERYDASTYWNDTVSIQRFTGKRIDLFLFFFAQLELPRRRRVFGMPQVGTLRRSRLYREFRYVGERVYRPDKVEFLAMLERLRRYADIYRKIDQPQEEELSDYAREVLRRRSVLGLWSLVPVFMALVDKVGYGARFDQSIRIVDSYLMRRVALKAYYSGFDEVAFEYVQALRDSPANEICSVLIEQFDKSRGRHWWPTDEDITLRFGNSNMYQGISKERIQLLLGAIAERIHAENPDLSMSFSPNPLTVEHVAPQGWERHWKSDLNFGNSDEDKMRLDRLVHRIGNLTLVTARTNHKLSNKPWSYKVELLRKDNLEMNQRLLDDMEGNIWNEEEIDCRGKQLAEYVIRIWPSADALRGEMGIAQREGELVRV